MLRKDYTEMLCGLLCRVVRNYMLFSEKQNSRTSSNSVKMTIMCIIRTIKHGFVLSLKTQQMLLSIFRFGIHHLHAIAAVIMIR